MLIRAMDINDLERIVELEHILFTSTWDVSDFMYEILENQFSYNENFIKNYLNSHPFQNI